MNRLDKEQTNSKMTDFIANISIIMLNMNELNPPVKRQRLSDQIEKKKDPTMLSSF